MTLTAATSLTAVRGLDLLTWPALDGVAVTTTTGGVSTGPYESLNLSLAVGDDPGNVMENRRRLAVALDASPADFVFARQVHGADVHVVTAADRGRGAFDPGAAPEADALVTNTPGIILAILAADCVPIALLDPDARVLACVHAGWRGTVARAVAAAVQAMVRLGARPENTIAGIGPAIGPDRYQVGAEVKQAAERTLGSPAASGFLRPDGAGRWLFDLPAANRLILREAGVPDSRILTAPCFPRGDDPPQAPPAHGGLLAPRTPSGGPPQPPVAPRGTRKGPQFFSDRAARPCGRHALVARLGES
jgi:polyphenol oxidase